MQSSFINVKRSSTRRDSNENMIQHMDTPRSQLKREKMDRRVLFSASQVKVRARGIKFIDAALLSYYTQI